MASANSPRQRMINLMYLVFIAMLALNMSKEVLTAFGILNEKLEYSNEEITKNNQAFLKGLEVKASENPDKYAELYQKGVEITSIADEYFKYLADIKTDMLKRVKDSTDYQIMDRSDYLDQYFFRADKRTPEGEEFLNRIISFREALLKITPNEYVGIKEVISNRFSTGDENNEVKNRDNSNVHWLNFHYEGYPMVASLTNITQIQSDVMNSTQNILKAMLQGQLTQEVSYSNYTTLLELEKSAFYQGENFQGNIVLGRKDSSTRPNKVQLTLDGKTLVDGRDFTIENGRVKLNVNAGNAGDHKIEGMLVFVQDGEETQVPVNASFVTITKPNAAVISADKMNVVCRGLDNPMTISIPGVANNFVTARADGLKKVSGSNYILNPGKGREISITASGKLPDGNTINTTSVFRIKDIPKPQGTIRGESGTVKMPRNNLEIASVGAMLEDFDFDLTLRVKGFKFKVPGQPTVAVNGDKLDARAKAALQRARRGDLIQIFDIDVENPDNRGYRFKNVTAVIIELTN